MGGDTLKSFLLDNLIDIPFAILQAASEDGW